MIFCYCKMDHYVCVHTGYPCCPKRLDKKGIEKIIDLINKDILVYGASFMRRDRESDIITLLNNFGSYYEDSEKMYKKCFRHNASLKNCECDDYIECHGMACERHCMCPIDNHCENLECNKHGNTLYVNKYYMGNLGSEEEKDKWPKDLCFSSGISYNREPIFIMKNNMKIYDIIKLCQDIYYCHIWSDWVSDFKLYEYNVKANGREIKFTIIKVEAESG